MWEQLPPEKIKQFTGLCTLYLWVLRRRAVQWWLGNDWKRQALRPSKKLGSFLIPFFRADMILKQALYDFVVKS